MVATRGGTRTSGADEADTSLALRKKPVRKTTAATNPRTTTKTKTTTTTAAKAKMTRSKTIEVTQDDTEDELSQPIPPEPAKATRQRATRVKKDDEPAKKAPAKASATTAKPASTTRNTAKSARPEVATRTSKARFAAASEDQENAAPKVPELKPTQSRATRATRTTASTSNAAPLSPKKNTQVSVAPKKIAQPADAKAAAGKAKKSAPRGRPPLKRRQVSDENADVPQTKPEIESEGEEIVVQPRKRTRANTATKSSEPEQIARDGSPASTRPSTPAESTQELIDDTQEETIEGSAAESQVEIAESEPEVESEQASADELFGAKTPMKRCDYREQARYSSIKKPSLFEAVPSKMRTPVRRFAVLGTQQGTPQTQKPYCQPTVPMSGLKSLTVARARSTAMVFPKLEPFQQDAEQDSIMSETDTETTVQDEGTPVPRAVSDMMDLGIEPSEYSTELEPNEQDSDTSLLIDASLESIVADDLTHDITQDQQIERQSIAADQGDDPVVAPAAELVSDETITINEASQSSPQSDSTILCDEDDANPDVSNDELEVIPSLATPRPETLVWENIRQDVTIPFDFDSNALVARSPVKALETAVPRLSAGPLIDLGDFLVTDSPVKDRDASSENLKTTVEDSEEVQHNMEGDITMPCDDTSAATSTPCSPVKLASAEDAPEVDVAVEGDITLNLEEPAARQSVPHTPIKLSAVEDAFEADPAVQGDFTMIINDASDPGTVKRSPIKLSTFEDEEEEDLNLAAQGEHTLLLSAPSCPGTIRRSPIKLSTIENVDENETLVGGDITMVLRDISTGSAPELPATPALVNETRDSDVTSLDLQNASTPRYARSTIASRRKSISAADAAELRAYAELMAATPSRRNAWFDDMELPAGKTPGSTGRSPSRPRNTSRPGRISNEFNSRAVTPAARSPVRSVKKPGERFPGLPAQQTYEELLDEVAAATRIVPQRSEAASGERYPGMPPRQTYDAHVEMTPQAMTPRVSTPFKTTPIVAKTPPSETAGTKRKMPDDESPEENSVIAPTSAVPERFPGLPSRQTYEAHHAKTALPPTRFRTPVKQPGIRRPATAQKPTSLRKLALKAATPMINRTTTKTPLKEQAQTPGQVAMTPHPSAPLRNVVALVDVYTSDGGCASQSFTVLLKRLGAKTTKTFSERVTHVVFKDGSPKLLQALVIHNKQVAETGSGNEIFCVNSRWVNDCEAQGKRMPEGDEDYVVDVDGMPGTAKRRRKSMEPMSLLNHGGNIVRDRKSAGRVSIGRASSAKLRDSISSTDDSSLLSGLDAENKENVDVDDGSEPGTPMYLKKPDALVQQTAPINKVKKLDLGSEQKGRRLTFMNGLDF